MLLVIVIANVNYKADKGLDALMKFSILIKLYWSGLCNLNVQRISESKS